MITLLKLWLVVSLLSFSLARADLVASVGVGKGILEGNGTPFDRFAALGYQVNLGVDFFVRPEISYWEDLSGHGKSSFLVGVPIGIRALAKAGLELHLAVGPAWLQNPDQILGGHFQFSLEGGIGLSSADGKVYVGPAWKHASSAGFEMPNMGRDEIVAQARYAF